MTGNLRKLARGMPCMARFPGICNFDESTTVLCHIRRANIAGIGQKPNDLCAFLGCSACHDYYDKRTPRSHDDHEVNEWVLDALLRTIEFWSKSGLAISEAD